MTTDTAITTTTANRQLLDVFAPWVHELGLVVELIEGDTVKMRLPYNDRLCRHGDSICGQALMTLIDTCMVFVCYLAQGRYGNCTTVSQNTSFMRPVVGQDVVATGRIVKAGRQLVFGEVSLHTAGDASRVACAGTSTYMLLPD
jgi:uncharacterized protein (TIGR00369 family)